MKAKRYIDKRINYLFHIVLCTFEVGPQSLGMELGSCNISKAFCAYESPLDKN